MADDLIAGLPRSAFQSPGSSRGLLELFRWRYLLGLLVRTGVSTRYRNSALGWTWSYARPATQFLVFWLVLGVFVGAADAIPHYAVYLFSGIVVINLFSEGFKNATTSIVGNASLVRKVYLPRELFAVSAVIVGFVHFLPQVGLLIVACLFLGWIAHISLLSVVAIFAATLIVMMFSLGLGLFFGALNVRFRDAENVVELLLLLATWASPVLYSWTMVETAVVETLGWPRWVFQLYLLNPVTQAIELFHYAFWRPATAAPMVDIPPGLAWNTLWTFLIALATVTAGQLLFRRLEGGFAQNL
jgi:ABC-2 type transport system permease protein